MMFEWVFLLCILKGAFAKSRVKLTTATLPLHEAMQQNDAAKSCERHLHVCVSALTSNALSTSFAYHEQQSCQAGESNVPWPTAYYDVIHTQTTARDSNIHTVHSACLLMVISYRRFTDNQNVSHASKEMHPLKKLAQPQQVRPCQL